MWQDLSTAGCKSSRCRSVLLAVIESSRYDAVASLLVTIITVIRVILVIPVIRETPTGRLEVGTDTYACCETLYTPNFLEN